jgi:hypothetical protein
MVDRRQFDQGLIAVALSGLATHLIGAETSGRQSILGNNELLKKLIPDAKGVLALPEAAFGLVADPQII